MLFAWSGGAAFIGALLYLGYFYIVTLGSPAGEPAATARNVIIDVALFAAFALHHSLLARSGAKRALARVIPARFERSLYVWVASLLAVGMCVLWQPVPGIVYELDGWARLPFWATQLGGLLLTARAARLISALELAGVHQAAGRAVAQPLKFAGPFRIVRHPIYLGWMLMVFGTPTMTANRLLFATVSSLYLILAIPWEERSLVEGHGDQYRQYQRAVRWRVLPGLW